MTHLRLVTWRPADTPRAPAASLPRRLVAAVLRSASGALARLAQHVAEPTARAPASLPQTLEFYAEASAPEGALYVDGRLIGHLPGVKRL